MSGIRRPAVAGRFYPADPAECAAAVDQYLAAATLEPGPAPVALIVPHAGYVFSGPVAASGYRRLAEGPCPPRVLILGPAHTVPLDAMAVSGSEAWATPLGEVEIDQELRELCLALPATREDDDPHRREHGIEVHLPFLQRLRDDVSILPVVVGAVAVEAAAALIESVWDRDDVLVVVSTDLSHYHDHVTAARLDRRTASAIISADYGSITPVDACGVYPLRGLLQLVKRRGASIEQLDLRTSGDTAGGRDRVVGYGAFAVGGQTAA